MTSPDTPLPVSHKLVFSIRNFQKHWWQFMGLALLQSMTILLFLKTKPSAGFTRGSLTWDSAFSITLIVLTIFLSSLLFATINQTHTRITYNTSITLSKSIRRLFDACLCGIGSFLTAGLLLLPLLILATYPHWQNHAQSLNQLISSYPPFVVTAVKFLIMLSIGLWATYALNRGIYAPIMASVHTCPGFQCYKASYTITSGQWWQSMATAWIPSLIITAFSYNMLNMFITNPAIVFALCHMICLPLFSCLLITQMHDMLARHHLTIDQLTDHHPTITKPWQ
jgi:hypothetical protein